MHSNRRIDSIILVPVIICLAVILFFSSSIPAMAEETEPAPESTEEYVSSDDSVPDDSESNGSDSVDVQTSEPEHEPESESQEDSSSSTESEAEEETESETDSGIQTETDLETEKETESEMEAEIETVTESETDTKIEIKSESGTDTEAHLLSFPEDQYYTDNVISSLNDIRNILFVIAFFVVVSTGFISGLILFRRFF